MTLLHEHALLVLVAFPAMIVGMQVLLFLFPSEVGKTGPDRS